MIRKASIAIAFLTGLGLIFIGGRFLIAPEAAEAAFGLHFNEMGDYSFHYIKGIRDLFSGLLLCILVISGEIRALGLTLLAAAIVPVTDMSLVLSKDYNGLMQAVPHITAIIICVAAGTILSKQKTLKQMI